MARGDSALDERPRRTESWSLCSDEEVGASAKLGAVLSLADALSSLGIAPFTWPPPAALPTGLDLLRRPSRFEVLPEVEELPEAIKSLFSPLQSPLDIGAMRPSPVAAFPSETLEGPSSQSSIHRLPCASLPSPPLLCPDRLVDWAETDTAWEIGSGAESTSDSQILVTF
jgi:hypothetical protein